jgi:hypothetical protein
MKQLLIFIFIISLSSVFSFGQDPEKKFPDDKAKFISELGTFLTVSKQKEIEIIFNEFKTHAEGGRFTDEQFVKIQALCNRMDVLNMRATPYFANLLSSINVMIQKGFFKSHFDNWADVLISYLADAKSSQNSNFDSYVVFATELFEDNAIRTSKGNGLKWVASSNEFKFRREEDKIVVDFPSMNLTGIRQKDSIVINDTEGTFYPLDYIWKGKKGKVDWSRVGFDDKVYCTFEAYTIEVKKNNYRVQDVIFYHPTFFDGPVKGSFEDKVVVNSDDSQSYPRFESFNKNIEVKNLGDKIKYVGGFLLHGSSVIGVGGELYKARMDFLKEDGTIAATALAQYYTIRRDDYIVAQDVETSIYFDGDSIFHPNADFRFNIPERELILTRTGSGNSKILFYDSYHNLEIDAEKIGWLIDTDSIAIGQNKVRSAGGRPKEANFESKDYFDVGTYQIYQNIATTNPIAIIKVFSEQKNSRELDARELAKRLNPKYSLETIVPLLQSLVEDGFIYYDKKNELVLVKDRVFRYADASRQKVDYDVLKATSMSKNTNAVLDLSSKDLGIREVANVILSDSQLVALKPYAGDITFKQNRDMSFNGRVFAGFGMFDGKDFEFIYDQFKIFANDVDSFVLRVPDPNGAVDQLGMPILVPLGTRIEDMKGYIIIDESDNKSSRINNQHFPALYSDNPCYVYYDSKLTQAGAYDRDSFYFQIEPFVFDSLDSFDPADLKFSGQLVSTGIFPDFEETLRVRDDLSLGFQRESPPEGFPLYNGKGIYHGNISMNNKGLIGEGTIKYLTAVINSDEITFLPKQLLATADSFNLEEFRGDYYEFPWVRGEEVRVDWHPQKDSMYIETEEKPFNIFDENFSLTGLAILTPGGLYGDGIFDWSDAVMVSNNLRFAAKGVTADSTDMRIKVDKGGQEEFAFSTANVKADINFETNKGNFKSNSSKIATAMPYTKYRTSMDEFDWDMTAQTIDFRTQTNSAVFLSVHPQQDSLSFTGSSANYNLKTNLLKVDGVPFVQSADAFIYPKEGLIEVEADAKMKPLEDARIVANIENKYHTINGTNIQIKGKNEYIATGGLYEYNVGVNKQNIEFSKIEVLRTAKGPNKGKLVTTGLGSVKVEDNFYLDEKIFFQGRATLKASQKELEFNGFAKINSPVMSDSTWFSIDSPVDRNDVVLNYEEPRNLVGQKLETGIFIKRDTGLIYQRIFMAPYSRRDQAIFKTSGVLKYFPSTTSEGNVIPDYFLMGDSAKIIGNSRRGNVIKFDRISGNLDYEGTFILGSELPYVTIAAAGTGYMEHPKDENNDGINDAGSPKLDLVIGIEMIVPEKLLNYIIKDIEAKAFDLPDASYNQNHVKKGLQELIKDDKRLDKALAEMADFDKLNWPKGEKKYTFLFGNTPMSWCPERYSAISKKDGLTLSYINDVPVHKVLKDSYLETRMSRSKDEINLFIKSPSGNFYYFNYQNRVLSVVSTNPSFNDAVLALKKDEMTFKMPDGEFYEIKPTGVNAAKFFVARAEECKCL